MNVSYGTGWAWKPYRPRRAASIDGAAYRRLRRRPPPGYSGPFGIESVATQVKSYERKVAGATVKLLDPLNAGLYPGTGIYKPGFGPHADDDEVLEEYYSTVETPTNDQITAEVATDKPGVEGGQVVNGNGNGDGTGDENGSNAIYWVLGGVGVLAVGGIFVALLMPRRRGEGK